MRYTNVKHIRSQCHDNANEKVIYFNILKLVTQICKAATTAKTSEQVHDNAEC